MSYRKMTAEQCRAAREYDTARSARFARNNPVTMVLVLLVAVAPVVPWIMVDRTLGWMALSIPLAAMFFLDRMGAYERAVGLPPLPTLLKDVVDARRL